MKDVYMTTRISNLDGSVVEDVLHREDQDPLAIAFRRNPQLAAKSGIRITPVGRVFTAGNQHWSADRWGPKEIHQRAMEQLAKRELDDKISNEPEYYRPRFGPPRRIRKDNE